MRASYNKGLLIGRKLALGDEYEAKGRQDKEKSLAETFLKQAQAQKYEADARKINDRIDNRKQGRDEFFMGQTGLTLPQLNQVEDYMRLGEWSKQLEGPYVPRSIPQPRQTVDQPDFYSPEVAQQYRQAMAVSGANRMATGDSNTAQLGDIMMDLMKKGHIQDILAGQRQQPAVAGAYGAVEGKPVYDDGPSGILDQYTGGVSPTETSLSTVLKNQAAARSSDASAGAADALAELRGEQALNEATGEGGSNYKPSDDNAIYSRIASLFGEFDPETGRIVIKDHNQRKQIAAMASRATQIYRESQGLLSHAQAAERAIQEFGIALPTPMRSALDSAFSGGENSSTAAKLSPTAQSILERHLGR